MITWTKTMHESCVTHFTCCAAGFTHMENQGDIDMSIVRLCWQVFLPDPQGKFTRALKPVMSELIYDKSK